jgi:hypothetical protein
MSQYYKDIPLTIDIEREKLTFSQTPKFQVKRDNKRQKAFPEEYISSNLVKPFNQGSIGSCVGCSGKVIVTDSFVDKDLSALWIYNKAKKYDFWEGEDYSGTSIAGACQSLIKEGVCLEEFMPYVFRENVDAKEGAEQDALKRKFSSYYAVEFNNSEEIKQIIYEGKKIWTSFIVHEGFHDIKDGFIINEKNYLQGRKKGGHAVALVGWKEILGKLYWVFQNSWGQRWGDGGFFYVSHKLYPQIVISSYIIFRTENINKDDNNEVKEKETSKKGNIIVRILRSIVDIISKIFSKK